MQRIWTGGAVVAVIIGIVVALGYFKGPQPPQHADPLAGGTQLTDTEKDYRWIFDPASTTDEAMPRSTVHIAIGQEVRTIGTFDGTCAEYDTDLLPNEETKVVCWWAGGGNEIGVFTENGVRVVKVGDVDEGSAEEPGFRGNFRTVLDLSTIVPQRVTVVGFWECVPKKPGYPKTEECLWGIAKDQSDGHVVVNTQLMSRTPVEYAVGTKVRAEGVLTPANTLSSDRWQQYDIDGILSATVIEQI
jgi:hypothetical protein